MAHVKRKSDLEHAQNADSDHPAHVQTIIRAFPLRPLL